MGRVEYIEPSSLLEMKERSPSTVFLGILAEGAIALPVTLSGGVLFAS